MDIKTICMMDRFRTKNMIDFLAGRHTSPACVNNFLKMLAEGKGMEMSVAHAMYTHHRIQCLSELSDYMDSLKLNNIAYEPPYTTESYMRLFSKWVDECKPVWSEIPTEVIVGFDWSIANDKGSSASEMEE